MKILIGYDGSEYSDAALDDLHRAGLPADSKVLIASVADLLMSSPELSDILDQTIVPSRVETGLQTAQTHAQNVTKEAEKAALRAKERLRKLFPEWKIRAEVLVGTPAWVLIDVANKWNADLIVVGSQGRSALKRLLLGSVSKRVLTDSQSSVRVSRGDIKKDIASPIRLIIGVDGSPAAEQAVYAVGQRVWPTDTEVRLITVDDGTPTTPITLRLPQAARMIDGYYSERENRVSSMLNWAAAELNAIGLKTSVVALTGDPARVILEYAAEWNADSIFVGTRDFKTGFERFRLGSVSSKIVSDAHCSVEVVRPSDRT